MMYAMERRQPAPTTAFGCLEQMPASVMLERIPVPFIGIHPDSVIAYTNTAFDELLGRDGGELVGIDFHEICAKPPRADHSAFEAFRKRPRGVVELRHADGYPIKGIFSRSILVREDDPIAMVAFHDVTEQFWMYGEPAALPEE